MAGQTRSKIGYGLTDALPVLAPNPIVAKRAPTSSDMAPLGQIWVQPVTSGGVAVNAAWVLTSIISNSATWSDIAGGAGILTSLTVNPGPTSLSTVGNGAVTIGNATNTGAITLVAGVGNLAINGDAHVISIANDAAANSLILGTVTAGATTLIEGGNGTGVGTAAITFNTATTGDIQIGSVAHTGTIYLGVSTAGDTIDIGNAVNTGAQAINIADGAYGANSAVSILNGVGTAGTASFDLLSNSGQTLAATINIGRGGSVGGGANTIVIGSNSGASALTLASGTGNTVMNTAVTGTITIGSAAQTGDITLGLSTAGQTINIGNAVNTGAQIVNIASGASGANSTVNIMAGNGTAGTQTVTILSSTQAGVLNLGINTGAHNINIGGSGNNVIALGNLQTGGSISLGAAMTTGTISIGAATSGLVSVPPVVPTPIASPGTTIVCNARVGYAEFTGFTTAAAGTQTFTITNSTVTATSAVLATATNFGTNAAFMTVVRVLPGAGTMDIVLLNNGAAALNGNVAITFWVLS